jgi:hypothetical protein
MSGDKIDDELLLEWRPFRVGSVDEVKTTGQSIFADCCPAVTPCNIDFKAEMNECTVFVISGLTARVINCLVCSAVHPVKLKQKASFSNLSCSLRFCL